MKQLIWSRRMDMALMDLIADGHSFITTASTMGISKDAVAGRFRRLAERMGWQAK